MEPFSQTIISTLTFMTLTKIVTGFVYCPSWEYKPVKGEPCVPCSKCPENQIVRETCWGSRDTVCGPFTEFKPFSKGETMLLRGGDNHKQSDKNDVSKNDNVDVAESGSWKTITIVMICVLSVAGVLFIVLVAVTWHICRRQNKEALITQTDQERASDIPSQSQTSAMRQSGSRHSPNSSIEQPASHKIDQFEIDVSST